MEGMVFHSYSDHPFTDWLLRSEKEKKVVLGTLKINCFWSPQTPFIEQ